MTETLANGYSFERTHLEQSNEYQYDKVSKNLCILVLWTKVASAVEGLTLMLMVTINLTNTKRLHSIVLAKLATSRVRVKNNIISFQVA